ncbi:MFS transporter [Diaphorobacter aerolatus]|uniref:MFS transporter n=1 Tax=Diaphorobacter aerolatus TaxID=1288495 RepID=A0A7H0GL63_9BURK|nr:MFS transporter [Diaphorobacter aerolatus]QNP49029.1 MFS transporter [Diaphorobacter aerolatus]
MNAPLATSWRNIALAILAALIASFQIGKAIIALPLLQGEPLHLSLRQTGLVISALAIVGAVLAMPLGVLIARWDSRKVIVAGLGVVALASFAGASAGSIGLLLASRVLEGVAVVTLLICASSVVGRQASEKDRDLAMALSSTAVPGGIALVMLVATLASSVGMPLSWPAIWYVNAGLAAAFAVVILLGLPAMPPQASVAGTGSHQKRTRLWDAIHTVGTARSVQFIAICFALYAVIYFAFSGFLPLLLRDLLGLTPIQAGFVSAGIVAANVLGNMSAGALMRRGIASHRIVSAGFVVAAICIPMLFWLKLPPVVAAVCAAIMIGCMGGVPGALTAIAPKVAPSPTLIAPTIGFMLQGSYVGQLVGPMSAGALAQAGGWVLVAWMLLPLAVAGAILARKLK